MAEHRTIVAAFWDNVERRPAQPALRRRSGERWETFTWSDYGREVRAVTAGLTDLAVQPRETVGILSTNRLEWHLADLGVLSSGATTVPIYPTSAPAQVAYMLDHAEVRICFAENSEQVEKLAAVRDRLPKLDHVVLFEGDADEPFVMGFDSLVARGQDRHKSDPSLVRGRAAAVEPDDLATLVYTSGTTGPPKGSMITHANVIWTARSLEQVVPTSGTERFLSFLPLSHIAERMVSDFMQIAIAAETWFAQSLTTLAEDLRACRPTIFFAVPRVWEKFQQSVIDGVGKQSGVKGAVAKRYLAEVEKGRGAPYQLLHRLLGPQVRAQLGLDKARFLVSGAAPIHASLLRWFDAIGLPIAEVYGQTEDCGPATLNPPGGIRIGTVGTAIPGVEIRIASDGEILVKGGNVSPGYFKDEQASRETIDVDGWLHTGDLGALDADGYLSITGRKKDLIITAAGKNISPSEIETRLKVEPLISQAVLIGDGRKYVTALLTLDTEVLASRSVEDPSVVAEVAESVERVNVEHARVEGIKRWKVLAHDFEIGDELTPTLKVKRNVVAEKYAREIEEMYAGE